MICIIEFLEETMELQFDDVLKEWMKELLNFVSRARFSYELMGVLDKPEYEYLTLADSVTSQFFCFIMNEELSNSSGKFDLDKLCEAISLDNESSKIDKNIFKRNFEYMKEVAVNQFNTYF